MPFVGKPVQHSKYEYEMDNENPIYVDFVFQTALFYLTDTLLHSIYT